MNEALIGVACTVIASVLTSVGFLFQRSREYITRDEAYRIVAEHSPWTKDKMFVMEQIKTLSNEIIKIDDIQIQQARVSTKLEEVSHMINGLGAKLDSIVETLSRR